MSADARRDSRATALAGGIEHRADGRVDGREPVGWLLFVAVILVTVLLALA